MSRGEPLPFTAEIVGDDREGMGKILSHTRDTIRTCGVATFSTTPYEILMWSHYADHHKGFCIEFERNSTNMLRGDGGKTVNYQDRRPIIDGLDFFRDPEGVLNDILYTKAPCWCYEFEWRLVYFSETPGSLVREKPMDARMK